MLDCIWTFNNTYDDNNERISRAPFHVKHAQLRRTSANTKHMHIRHPKQHVSKQSCSSIQLSSKDEYHMDICNESCSFVCLVGQPAGRLARQKHLPLDITLKLFYHLCLYCHAYRHY